MIFITICVIDMDVHHLQTRFCQKIGSPITLFQVIISWALVSTDGWEPHCECKSSWHCSTAQFRHPWHKWPSFTIIIFHQFLKIFSSLSSHTLECWWETQTSWHRIIHLYIKELWLSSFNSVSYFFIDLDSSIMGVDSYIRCDWISCIVNLSSKFLLMFCSAV